MKLILLIAILFGTLRFSVGEDRLPPESVLGDWSELEKLNFSDWKIEKFNGWAIAFDGGSKGFFFTSQAGQVFNVVAANPGYWSMQDKKGGRQVFYITYNNKLYKLKEKSDEELNLISMLEEIRPELKGAGRKDPKLIDQLIKRIKSRKPMFKTK